MGFYCGDVFISNAKKASGISSSQGIVTLTYKTKLKLDKEVGGGVLLMRWICNFDVHTSLHALIVSFDLVWFD